MRLNVPRLLAKIGRHRPRVVCFVGKKIWDVFEGVVGKTAGGGGAVQLVAEEIKEEVKEEIKEEIKEEVTLEIENEVVEDAKQDVKMEVNDDLVQLVEAIPPSTPTKPLLAPSPIGTGTPRTPTRKTNFDWDKPRPFVLFHDEEDDAEQSSGEEQAQKRTRYTLFWVVPSTSGLERTPVGAVRRSFISGHAIDFTPPLSTPSWSSTSVISVS
jgi:TDG/mug DNA glycosylase family protein